MLAYPEMIALGLDVRVRKLVIQKLRVLGLPGNPPLVVIEKPLEEKKTFLRAKNFDLNEIRQLAEKARNLLFKFDPIMFDLVAQQDLQISVRELGL